MGLLAMLILLLGVLIFLFGIVSVCVTFLDGDITMEVGGVELDIPNTWDTALPLLTVGVWVVVLSLYFGDPGFRRRALADKRALAVGMVILVFGSSMAFLVRSPNAEWAMSREEYTADRTQQDLPKSRPRRNLYADRVVDLFTGNPTTDSMSLFINDSLWKVIKGREFEYVRLKPGPYRIRPVVKGDTIDRKDVTVPQGSREDKDRIYIFNPNGFFSYALLDYSDLYQDKKRRKHGDDVKYKLHSSWFGLRWNDLNISGASIYGPRRPSLPIGYNKALKMVLIPKEWEGREKKIEAYATWKLQDEDDKGFSQDGLEFFMKNPAERRKAIRNRLQDDVRRFEAEK